MDPGSNVGLIYGLEFQCRSLCPVIADTENVSFLVGTQGLKMINQIHKLDLGDDYRTLSKKIYSHPAGEIWGISSSHSNPRLFATRHSHVDINKSGPVTSGASIWLLPEDNSERYEAPGVGELELVCHLNRGSEEVEHVSWRPTSDNSQNSKVMVLVGNKLSLHDLSKVEGTDQERFSTVISSGHLDGKHGHDRLTTGAWNPHQNCQQFATANEYQVRGWDVRSMSQSWLLENPAHSGLVRSLDFNPNKQYSLAASGDDGAIRFWDIRNSKEPVAVRADHSHWVWSVRFNQFHDQLVLTSSSDGRVVLSCMASISSEPLGHIEDDEEDSSQTSEPLVDGVIQVFDDHEDSVYTAEWSSADPWIFASLSFDGRLVINRVPKKVKFRILNLI